MEQSVPGSQNEHFFELLYPIATRGSPPPPPPATTHVVPAADGLSPEDISPVHAITPSYDFHLTHSIQPPENSAKTEIPLPVPPRASSLTPSGEQLQGSSVETSRRLVYGKPINPPEATRLVTMDAIEGTIKQSNDNLITALDSVNERLSRLETTVQGLEHTIAGLKLGEGGKQDLSNEKLMNLEMLITEVHRGVRILQEKQRLDEAQSQTSKLSEQNSAGDGLRQTPPEGWQQSKIAKEEVSQVAYTEPAPQLPHHLHSQYPPPPHAHYHPAPPPPQMQAFSTSQGMAPIPSTMSALASNQQTYPSHPPQPSSHAPPPPPLNTLQSPAFHSQQAQLPPPQSSYNVPMETTPYSHMQPQHQLPPPPPLSSTYIPEPSPYTGGMHGSPRQPPMPQEVLHPPQQQHNSVGSHHMYEQSPGRMAPTAMAPPYGGQPSIPKPAPSIYETAGSGGAYGTPPYRTAQPVPSAPSKAGGGYPRLPTAQPIQHGLPAANPPTSSGPSNRRVDDVVERVANMGFHREQVRGVVRQLSEAGQSVEYNAVLDKLMNGGDISQPARGWFNRG